MPEKIKKVKVSGLKNIINKSNMNVEKNNKNSEIELCSFKDDFPKENPIVSNTHGYDLLIKNGIKDYTIHDILSAEVDPNNSKNLIVETKDNIKFLFIEGENGAVLQSFTTPDGFTVECNIKDYAQDMMKEHTNIKDDVKIKGYSKIGFGSKSTYVYWVGDKVSVPNFVKKLKILQEAMEFYPENVTDYVLGKDHFTGFYIGDKSDQRYSPKGDWVAYADSYVVYIDGNNFSTNISDSYYKQVIVHEFAHIIDNNLGREYEGYGSYSDKGEYIEQLYNKYKQTIQPLLDSMYGFGLVYPDGVPNAREFFACTVEMYYKKPDKLKEEIPELYEHFDGLLKKI